MSSRSRIDTFKYMLDNCESVKTDILLLEGIRNQEEDEWSKFYDRYALVVYNFARKLGCSPEMAEDILQDSMMTLWRVLPRFQYNPKRGKFRSFLFKIAETKIRDTYRRNKRYKPISSNGEYLSSDKDCDREIGTEVMEYHWDHAFEENILSKAILVVQEKVQPTTFKSFLKVFIEKKEVKEVAKILNIPPNRVSQHKHTVCKLIIQEAKRLREEYGE